MLKNSGYCETLISNTS